MADVLRIFVYAECGFAGGMVLYKICTDLTPWLGQSCRVTLFLWNYPRNSSTCACIVVTMQSVVGDSYPKLILWNIVYSGSLCFSCVRTCDRFLTLISIFGLPTLMLLNHSWGRQVDLAACFCSGDQKGVYACLVGELPLSSVEFFC